MVNTNPNHRHTYDAQGKMLCCSLEEKIYIRARAAELLSENNKSDKINDGNEYGNGNVSAEGVEKGACHKCCDDDNEVHEHHGNVRLYVPAAISMFMLLAGLVADYCTEPTFFTGYVRLAWYLIAYLPVGLPVFKEACEALHNREFFTEFTLMLLASLGAFAICEYPEGVAVMLFYTVGELFQGAAVSYAKGNIKALLDIRPNTAAVLKNGKVYAMKPEEVLIGEIVQVKAGEKTPLDGEILNAESAFNTAAITGESRPRTIRVGEQVLAGMINLDKVVELRVTRMYADSSLARILEMVQNATARKARTELLIRRFAKVYTPIVFILALALVFAPTLFVKEYVFSEWLYRALIFLVISCPCALVVSIPLGYFGGIGAASKNGILFKGSNFLDLITRVNTVVMDKTGTLTKGVFRVQTIYVAEGVDEQVFINTLAALERCSTHPIAKAIAEYIADNEAYKATFVKEISGYGLHGTVNGNDVLAGNSKLLQKQTISYPSEIDALPESIVVVAINHQYAGYVIIADEIKDDASQAIYEMRQNGITQTVILSGDKSSITQKVAQTVGIDSAYGDLLPEDKVRMVEELKRNPNRTIAFVGDGVNDAPVLALSDVGIAMGLMGSDAAIETADVVIQTDRLTKITTAIKIGKATKRIVIQNIALAFGVKVAVLLLGAAGCATMWEAVFADVGVALLAILNAIRIQRLSIT
jgi:Cd2+/Zn2+-exporting ATPase